MTNLDRLLAGSADAERDLSTAMRALNAALDQVRRLHTSARLTVQVDDPSHQTAWNFAARARREVVCTLPNQPERICAVNVDRPDSRMVPTLSFLAAGGREVHVVYDQAVMRCPAAQDMRGLLDRAGVHTHPTTRALPTMMIIDGEITLLPAENDPSGLIVIRIAAVAASLREHALGDQDTTPVPFLAPSLVTAAHALATHPTVEAAAAATGLSARQFRRHVAALLTALRASNHFQAGIAAAHTLGLIPTARPPHGHTLPGGPPPPAANGTPPVSLRAV